jgi:hypothetical protein
MSFIQMFSICLLQLLGWLDVLKGQGVGMDEPLVDAEDFPRNDIDLVRPFLTGGGGARQTMNS